MALLFSYGTLQDPQIQQKHLGRSLKSTPDSIRGFKLADVLSDGAVYPILIPTKNNTPTIKGVVFVVTQAELEAFDLYEGSEYQRSLQVLESGQTAWVYHQ